MKPYRQRYFWKIEFTIYVFILFVVRNNKKENEARLLYPDSPLQLTRGTSSQHEEPEQGQDADVAEQMRSLHTTACTHREAGRTRCGWGLLSENTGENTHSGPSASSRPSSIPGLLE